jgi:hypothetical protein
LPRTVSTSFNTHEDWIDTAIGSPLKEYGQVGPTETLVLSRVGNVSLRLASGVKVQGRTNNLIGVGQRSIDIRAG